MKRRDFLVQAAASGLYAGTFGTDGKRLIGSAIAAEGNGTQEDNLELKFADFALSVRYEDLPKEVITSAKRVLLDTLACAFGAVGSEPGRIAEQTIRKTFGGGRRRASLVIRAERPSKALFLSMACSYAPSTSTTLTSVRTRCIPAR